jgi:hypothetical protein
MSGNAGLNLAPSAGAAVDSGRKNRIVRTVVVTTGANAAVLELHDAGGLTNLLIRVACPANDTRVVPLHGMVFSQMFYSLVGALSVATLELV